MGTLLNNESEIDDAEQASSSGKYLTFVLGGEEYGIEILTVREIISVIEITAMPNMPEFVKGVINLRGTVIPVVDLRLKFGMKEKEYDKETCTIVVNLGDHFMGIIVDTVSEVLDIEEKDIDDPPTFGQAVDRNFILGMGKIDEKNKVVILLDITKLLDEEGFASLANLETQQEQEQE